MIQTNSQEKLRCFSRQEEARNMKLLILGGSGFVSGRLAQIATAQGHEVWCCLHAAIARFPKTFTR